MSSDILKRHIKELAVSSTFAAHCEIMGYETLELLLNDAPEVIRSKKEFSYTWLGELVALLTENQLLHLLQPIQGNSAV